MSQTISWSRISPVWKQTDKYNPLQRLSEIFRREEQYIKIPRVTNNIHSPVDRRDPQRKK